MVDNNLITIKIDEKDVAVQPSIIDITTEHIRNAERALDGTMCIEEVAQKVAIVMGWDFVSNEDYQKLKNQFRQNLLKISGAKDLFPNEVIENYVFYLEDMTAIPKIINNKFYWQSVSIKVVEV